MRVLGLWANDVSRVDGYEFKLKNEAGTKLADQTVRNIGNTVTFDEIKYTTTVNKEETSEIRLTVEALEMPAAFVNKMVTTGFEVTTVWQDGNEGAISLTLYAVYKRAGVRWAS